MFNLDLTGISGNGRRNLVDYDNPFEEVCAEPSQMMVYGGGGVGVCVSVGGGGGGGSGSVQILPTAA